MPNGTGTAARRIASYGSPSGRCPSNSISMLVALARTMATNASHASGETPIASTLRDWAPIWSSSPNSPAAARLVAVILTRSSDRRYSPDWVSTAEMSTCMIGIGDCSTSMVWLSRRSSTCRWSRFSTPPDSASTEHASSMPSSRRRQSSVPGGSSRSRPSLVSWASSKLVGGASAVVEWREAAMGCLSAAIADAQVLRY